jgi:hypothetical protein
LIPGTGRQLFGVRIDPVTLIRAKYLKGEILSRKTNLSILLVRDLAEIGANPSLRELPSELKPEFVYGCEVWRDLDWMVDSDKIVFDVSAHENLAAALLGIFDSQICGGKRYDLATMGRRRTNATYYASDSVDITSSLIYAMDLAPLIRDTNLEIKEYITEHIKRFAQEVTENIEKLLSY